jgi:hypothetical protein
MVNFFLANLQRPILNGRLKMPTTSLGTLRAGISLALLFFCYNALSCSFSLQMGARLPSGEVDLSNADRLKLANLVISVRNSPANDGIAVIYASANRQERQPAQLARNRAASVRAYLVQLGVDPSRMRVDAQVVDRAKSTAEQRHEVEIEFVPECPPQGCDSLCGAPAQ